MAGPDTERARSEAAGWLVLLEDEPADRSRQAEFRAWLAAAPANEAAWRSVSHTSRVLARAGDDPSNGSSRPSHPHAPAGLRWLLRPRHALVAAAVVCLLAVFAPGLLVQLRADHTTGTGQISSLRLNDGSSVQLGPSSALRLDFSPKERRVMLMSGEALFDVTHDEERPFRVITRDTTTTVLGTRFDVAQMASGTSVAVARGHVQVEASVGGASFDLRPGDWVRVGTDGTAEEGGDMPGYLLTGPGSRLAVRNRPVAEVIERLRPWFGGRIVIADEGVGSQPVTGVFDTADPGRALEAIVGPQGGRVIRVTPWLLIVAKG